MEGRTMSERKGWFLFVMLWIVGFLLPAHLNAAPARKLMVAVGQEPTSWTQASLHWRRLHGSSRIGESSSSIKSQAGTLNPGLAASLEGVQTEGDRVHVAKRVSSFIAVIS